MTTLGPTAALTTSRIASVMEKRRAFATTHSSPTKITFWQERQGGGGCGQGDVVGKARFQFSQSKQIRGPQFRIPTCSGACVVCQRWKRYSTAVNNCHSGWGGVVSDAMYLPTSGLLASHCTFCIKIYSAVMHQIQPVSCFQGTCKPPSDTPCSSPNVLCCPVVTDSADDRLSSGILDQLLPDGGRVLPKTLDRWTRSSAQRLHGRV